MNPWQYDYHSVLREEFICHLVNEMHRQYNLLWVNKDYNEIISNYRLFTNARETRIKCR